MHSLGVRPMTPVRVARQIWDEYQGIIALVVTFGAGIAVALTMAGWIQLPAKVDRQGDAIVQLQGDVSELKRDVPRMRCILEAMAAYADPVQKCGLVQ